MPSPDPVTDSSQTTPFSTPLTSNDDPLLSPLSAVASSGVGPLVVKASKTLAEAINSFKSELDERDGFSASVMGRIDIVVNSEPSRSYTLSLVHDEEGEEHPVTVKVVEKNEVNAPNGHAADPIAPSSTSCHPNPSYKPTRRTSDATLEQDIIPRRKRKEDGNTDLMDGACLGRKRMRMMGDDEDECTMPVISKDDLRDLLAKMREDIQEDTTECANHVQRLLRKWREQWYEKSCCEYDILTKLERQGVSVDKDAFDTGRSGTRPSISDMFAVPDGQKDPIFGLVNIPDLVRKESKQLSNQIRWVEQCRRIASEAHDAREETWRTSSAIYHDQARQNRENFEKRMLSESAMQGNLLNQIMSEVKGLASVALSLKWETPGQYPPSAPYPAPVPSSQPGQPHATPGHIQRPHQVAPQQAGRCP